ncbi:MAG: hypothetical protein QOE35_2786 [Actinomycetota bacterium]
MTVAQPQELDDGYLAVLGHRVLGSASVVSAAVDTLRQNAKVISPSNRALLDAAIDRHLALIADVGRRLAHGDIGGADGDG